MARNSNSQRQATVELLTGEQGPYPLPADLRQHICLTSAGDLYLANARKRSPQVLAFIDQLQRNNVPFKVQLVNFEFIANCYLQEHTHQSHDGSWCQNKVTETIQTAVQAGASDVHIVVRNVVTYIKFRVDGELQLADELSSEDGHNLCATIYQTMCDVAEPVFNPNRSQDARLMSSMLEGANLFGGRVATRPTDDGLLMVIRLLYDRGNSQLELESLGYLPMQVEAIGHMASRRFGINILSGPTGSGKSTTLECVLKKVIAQHEHKSHILTLEDPPEYRINGAVQTPIICDKNDDNAINREWARAIANAMRLDPDILMCGEVRDAHSAVATFRAAMTGHGVWTTIHANDALAILTRLQDIGISPSLLGDAALITGLVNQVLVRKLCERCKRPYQQHASTISKSLQTRVANYCQPELIFVRGGGCEHCKYSGIVGRTVVAEVIEPDSGLMDCFLQHGKPAARRYWLEQLRGVTKNHNLITLIDRGVIDPRDGEQDVCMLDHDAVSDGYSILGSPLTIDKPQR